MSQDDMDDGFDIDAHISRRIDEELSNDVFIDEETSQRVANDANDASFLQIPCLTPGKCFKFIFVWKIFLCSKQCFKLAYLLTACGTFATNSSALKRKNYHD